jgi:hypothetical protein
VRRSCGQTWKWRGSRAFFRGQRSPVHRRRTSGHDRQSTGWGPGKGRPRKRPAPSPGPASGPRGSARTRAGSRWGDASTAGRPGSQGPAPAARTKAGDHENFGSSGDRPWQIGSGRGWIEERPSDWDDCGNSPGDPRGSSPPFVASDFARTRPRNMACRATLRRRTCRAGVTCGCRHGAAGPRSGAFDSVGPALLGIPTPRRGGRATSVGRGRVGEPSTGVRAIASIARPAQGDLP